MSVTFVGRLVDSLLSISLTSFSSLDAYLRSVEVNALAMARTLASCCPSVSLAEHPTTRYDMRERARSRTLTLRTHRHRRVQAPSTRDAMGSADCSRLPFDLAQVERTMHVLYTDAVRGGVLRWDTPNLHGTEDELVCSAARSLFRPEADPIGVLVNAHNIFVTFWRVVGKRRALSADRASVLATIVASITLAHKMTTEWGVAAGASMVMLRSVGLDEDALMDATAASIYLGKVEFRLLSSVDVFRVVHDGEYATFERGVHATVTVGDRACSCSPRPQRALDDREVLRALKIGYVAHRFVVRAMLERTPTMRRASQQLCGEVVASIATAWACMPDVVGGHDSRRVPALNVSSHRCLLATQEVVELMCDTSLSLERYNAPSYEDACALRSTFRTVAMGTHASNVTAAPQ